MSCASCGSANPEGARFCNGCGQLLSGSDADGGADRGRESYTPRHLREKILVNRSALEGERKRVTVLFCDVRGSMELAESVDPEAWHAILDRFFQILAEGVHRFEGTVNQYTGDGIMALFGAPIAHEDHAQRACYSALHLLEQVGAYADELRRRQGLNFSVRMGLNSGEVIVGKIGDDLRMDYTAQGHTVGLAQRIEQLASPDRCYLTDHTARLVRGFFDLRDLGEFELKGSKRPLHVWELQGPGSSRTRLEVSESRGFSRFVGRETEMAALEAALERSLDGRGQLACVIGAAGLGKSRLCAEFLATCHARDLPVHRTHCPGHGGTTPFQPLRVLLRSLFAIHESDPPEEARRKIAGTLVLIGEESSHELPYVFEFLGVGDPNDPAPAVDADTRRELLYDFFVRLTGAQAARTGLVLLWDDVHWIDPASERALVKLADSLASMRALVLVNYRPEYERAWPESVRGELTLEPLGPEAIELLLDDLVGRDASLVDIRERIRERVGGNPFFTEEVVQTLVESNALVGAHGDYRAGTQTGEIEIPDTVQPILASRIDRLGEREKELLQTASVVGKRFPEPLLSRVAELSDADFAAALMTLQDGEFLRVETLFPKVEYAFKHPLTQEVAYDSQLSPARARLHGNVARALIAIDDDKLEERAAAIARHLELAGEELEAARWHLRAVEWLAGFDVDATVRHLESARSQAKAADDREAAAPIQLAACVGLVGPIASINRPELLREVFDEGRALAESLNDEESLLTLLVLQGIHAQRAGDLDLHERLLAEAREIASDHPVPRFVIGLQSALSQAKRGEMRTALEALDGILDIADAEPEAGPGSSGLQALMVRTGVAETFVQHGFLLGHAGRLEEAEGSLERALEYSRRHRIVAAEIDALSARATLSRWRGDVEEFGGRADELRELAARIRSPLWSCISAVIGGEAELDAGNPAAAVQELEGALELMRSSGVMLDAEPLTLVDLARAQLALGDPTAADAALREAEAHVQRSRDRDVGVRIQMARAELALASGDAPGTSAGLAQARAELEDTGNWIYAPHVSELEARAAELEGDRAAEQRALETAARGYREAGAIAHADRVETLLKEKS